ncbi:MAG: major capsid protein [Microviridae sp.]|nr:MAG: major capsid protein [Microviridae sp.]
MKFFSQKIKVGPVKASKFDLSHERKMSLNFGKLVPTLVQDVIPGDNIKVKATELFMRFAPMLAPVMHRVNVYQHYFFVPNRIIWDEWESFITGGEDGNAKPVFPTIRVTEQQGTQTITEAFGIGSLADYLGVGYTQPPVAVTTNPYDISALPFRAYQQIFNDYFRDQNVEGKIAFPKTGGDQTLADTTNGTTFCENLLTLRNRAWEKDYFTTSLPWPQRNTQQAFAPIDNYSKVAGGDPMIGGAEFQSNGKMSDAGGAITQGELLINELRKANKLQEWLEKQARGGGRMFETILSHFGVKISDGRVQRSEYLGGGRTPVKISEVLSTYDNTAGDLPQGNMSGHGIASNSFQGFNRSFEEHGYIIGIMSVLPLSAYQNGLERHWLKKDKFDFAWPSFANLGEQEVKTSEIYYDCMGAAGQGTDTWGYQSRYAEYKFKQSSVHGDLREQLLYWHLGRDFSAQPVLNQNFIACKNTETDRIFAVQDPAIHKLWCQIYHDVSAIRPLPYYGTPKL